MSNIFYFFSLLYYRKRFFLLLLIFFSPSFAKAQNDIIYQENFNSKSDLWSQYKANNKFGTIKNGVFEIKSQKKDAIRMFLSQIFINYKKNFTIETRMRQIAGKTNKGYGITWGTQGWQNSYLFLISSSGYFSIGKYVDSIYHVIKPWTKSSIIKPIKKYNKLKIAKIGNNLLYYINNKPVFTQYCPFFFGQMHGFILQSAIACQVDFLKISNDIPRMDIADVNFKGRKKNIGSKINTKATEIAPIISPDGQTLYFARGNSTKNPHGYSDEADIWYSKKQKNGTWGLAKNIGKPLNNSGVNVVVNIMPDGNTMFLEGLYNSDGSFKSDQGISVSHRTKTGWSVPKKVKIDNFYNKNIYETYFFTSDQKVLIMAIERNDSYGDLDLYVSFRRSDGSYTEPKNMGAVINTFADEGTPFLAPDGKTLYFSTSGLQGFGSNDIYMTKRLDNSWLKWSKPKNLGASINTNDWDTYLSLSARGDTAFLVSTANSIGNEDIFTIEMSKKMQPDAVVLISGRVLDKNTKLPLAAKITYQDLNTGKEIGIARSNPKTGKYKIVLPYGKLFGFRAEAKNYIATNENIDLSINSNYKEIKRNLFLSKIKVGEVIVLNNVFFERGLAKLKKTSFPELDRIAKIMKDNPSMKIELSGHTDNRGNKQALLRLSQERVLLVKKYLTDKGISAKRITTKAFGGTKPINKNDTEAEHAKNRRVEFKILII